MDEPNEEWTEEAYDEAELSDDEFEEECSYDDLLDRVESNDPNLSKLEVSLFTFDGHPHRLDRFATALSKNTQLKSLMMRGDHELIGEQINEAQAMNLLRGIACNQSIKRLHLHDYVELENAWSILAPLFKKNQVERVSIDNFNCKLSIDSARLLSTSLAEFDSLKEFDLTSITIQDEPGSQQVARELMQSLSGHSRLRKLRLLRTNVGKLGCSALVDLLRNPNINLRDLDLSDNNLGDAEAAALSFGMAGNTSMKDINLNHNGITEVGWQALFGALSNSSCRLEGLSLHGNEINDAAAQFLSDALASITTLKTLDLGGVWGITTTGWRNVFDFLRNQTCALENFDLSDSCLNDEVTVSLTEALASNSSLKSLDLNSNYGVTGAAWQIFFSTVLANPSSELEKLDLVDCAGINATATRSLTNALLNNSKLKVLDLSSNHLITNAGCMGFSSVLESPHTALEKLDLQGSGVEDDTATLLVNSLTGNKKLKELIFDHSYDWEAPPSVVCNADSIMTTYNSNHILENLGYGYDDCSAVLLQINRENSPNQAARIKIIKTHFSGGFTTQPFVGMDLNLLPHAMAWMGRVGSRACEVEGYYFSFIKSISSLFKNAN